jgi:acyl-CoA reductase-like NAD-dependent aldehyde dehydrogenase
MIESRDKLYIGGEWLAAVGRETIAVINPATEEILGHIPSGVAADVDLAVAAAGKALAAWAETPLAQRVAFVEAIKAGLAVRQDEIATLISQEVGTPIKLSQRIQAALPIADIDSVLAAASELPWQESIGNSTVYREPKGVVACITPWNYPLHQVVSKVSPALLAGCTVILKPSEVAPFSAFVLAEVIAAAGLPAGVFNLVTGYGPTVGEALAAHPGVDMVSFTGSTTAGKRVAELAAPGVKRVALELGGKSASIVLDDADLPKAIKGTLNSCFLNSGQTCNALTRLLVPAERYDEIVQLVVDTARAFTPGDPLAADTRLGPLVSDQQRERVRTLIRSGIDAGAELLIGGAAAPAGLAKGFYVEPTVFGRVEPHMQIAQAEIFGPVLCVMTYRDDNEAVRIANDTVYGLAGAVWSNDPLRANALARKLRVGQVDINGARFNFLAPFGGYKQSGLGRELGRFGLEEFLEIKAIQN